MRGASFATLGLGLSLSLGLGAIELPGQTTDRKPPSFEASVSLVPVAVFVLDRSGRAVADLRREDFEVLDRGRKQEIVAYEAVNALAPLPAAGRDAPAPPAALQASSHRQFLLLFDVSLSRPLQLLRASQAAARLVEEGLGPRDLVAVATASTRHGLKLLVGFTPDREQEVRAIETLGVTQKPDPSDPLGLTFAPSSGSRVPPDWTSDDAGEPGDETEPSPPAAGSS
jgi:VWFA-related protein